MSSMIVEVPSDLYDAAGSQKLIIDSSLDYVMETDQIAYETYDLTNPALPKKISTEILSTKWDQDISMKKF